MNKKGNKFVKIKKIYLNYYFKIIISVLLFCLLILLSFISIKKSIAIQEEKNVSYEEHGNSNYKVYLKNNSYYKEDYLNENMSYISNLIDYISIDYNYNFISDTLLNGEYYYKIFANLEIINSDSKLLFYSKTYDLLEEKKFKIENQKEYNIKENIRIDYDHYNSLANNFKSFYGVNAISELRVYLDVYRNIDDKDDEKSKIDGEQKIRVVIPLSEKSIDIKNEPLEIKNQNIKLVLEDYKVDDIKFLILGLLLLAGAIVLFILITKRIIKLQNNTSEYDKLLKKILRQYDRLIVNTKSIPNFDDYNVTKVDDFSELLDAKDNIHKPIFYYELKNVSYFFIKSDNEMIIYTLEDNK